MSTKKLLGVAALSSAFSAGLIFFTLACFGRITVDAVGPKADWSHRSLDDQYRTAIHEAGHVVGGCALQPNLNLKEVWVLVYKDPDSSTVGLTVSDPTGKTPASTDADTVWSLGGGAAEKVVYGADPVLDSIDSDTVDDTLISVCAKPGGCGDCPDESRVGGSCMLNGVVLQKHAQQFERTVLLIEANKETVVDLANLLMQQPIKDHRRRLDAKQLRAFLTAHPLVAPKALPDMKIETCK